jgi:hypothetical protein
MMMFPLKSADGLINEAITGQAGVRESMFKMSLNCKQTIHLSPRTPAQRVEGPAVMTPRAQADPSSGFALIRDDISSQISDF